MTTTADTLRTHLHSVLDDPARAWLDRALTGAATPPADPAAAPAGSGPPAPRKPMPAWELRFAEAGRRCGPTHADDARVLLLLTARPDADTLRPLYDRGTAAERRAVLRALHELVPGTEAVPLVEDALRTNDTSLVAAALGPYAAEHLDAHTWRHAVLKCLFTGVPVDSVAGLGRRAAGDRELARMLHDYASERTAAGRTVPDDLHRVLDLTAPPAERGHLPAAAGGASSKES
ncbi:sugar phosphate isomerase [Streptomyces triticagri]|uniref:Sugar phosphate isomerase n=1 Tax=Streptomyces triticagri TaxID=2293568 RepID=A0A372LYT0_9ACTN|nr:EboA domain-containing protein [Streptomyces triticagri]RFU83791.1 sugar phosphate isomerase [Streptomyces triticagri]